ncbi:hypothetical protein M3Y95_01104800 [Aphelenchoides besseyi]|nr:hypothetical protein M3Y95_01104800 [Aphelenchoides besseyi]
MPIDVTNLEELEKFLSGQGNVNVRDKNLLIKFMLPKTNEEIELDCDDDSKFSERFRDSLHELVKNLNEGEELILDIEIRLGFKNGMTLEQQREELAKAEEAAKEFYSGSAASSFYRSNVCGPFDFTPQPPNLNRNKLYKKHSLVPVTNLPANALASAQSIDEFYEKMDSTQDDYSHQKRKKKAKK